MAPGPAHRCASFSHTRSCTYEWRSGCTVVDKICMPRNWKKLQPRQLIAGEVAISFSFSVSCMPCTVGVRLPLRLDGKGQKSTAEAIGNLRHTQISFLMHPQRWTSFKFYSMTDNTVFTSVRTELLMRMLRHLH